MPRPDENSPVECQDDFISIDAARRLLAPDGRPIATRERVFALGLDSQIVIKRFASRWFVSRPSIESWRTREAVNGNNATTEENHNLSHAPVG